MRFLGGSRLSAKSLLRHVRTLVAVTIEAEAKAIAWGTLLTQSYVPPISYTAPRDAFCSPHLGDAPPLAYAFGYASPRGYAY